VTAVGRLLRTLRSARGMTIEETCDGADIALARLRRLERGHGVLEYLEGIRLAKSLDLCPNCFRRLLEAAAERDLLSRPEDDGAGDASGDRPPPGDGIAPAGARS